jgi:hypothetical protein
MCRVSLGDLLVDFGRMPVMRHTTVGGQAFFVRRDGFLTPDLRVIFALCSIFPEPGSIVFLMLPARFQFKVTLRQRPVKPQQR